VDFLAFTFEPSCPLSRYQDIVSSNFPILVSLKSDLVVPCSSRKAKGIFCLTQAPFPTLLESLHIILLPIVLTDYPLLWSFFSVEEADPAHHNAVIKPIPFPEPALHYIPPRSPFRNCIASVSIVVYTLAQNIQMLVPPQIYLTNLLN
jgi:hypothetical protein